MPGSHRGDLFDAGGEAGRLMAEVDWSSTPVGPVDSWPASLRFAVRTVLVSRFPMVLTWGPDFLQFYNDAYAPLIGAKHPAIGEDIRLTLAEGWEALGPPIDRAMDDPRGVVAAGPAAAAGALRLPRGDLLHRLPRPGLRRRRSRGRDARRLHRDDRPDRRSATAAAAARPGDARAASLGDERTTVDRACARRSAATRSTSRSRLSTSRGPARRGSSRIAASGCDADLLPATVGRIRRPARGVPGGHRRAVGGPGHRGRRPPPRRQPRRRRPSACSWSGSAPTGHWTRSTARSTSSWPGSSRARSSTSGRSRRSAPGRSPSPSWTARRRPSSPTSATSSGRR